MLLLPWRPRDILAKNFSNQDGKYSRHLGDAIQAVCGGMVRVIFFCSVGIVSCHRPPLYWWNSVWLRNSRLGHWIRKCHSLCLTVVSRKRVKLLCLRQVSPHRSMLPLPMPISHPMSRLNSSIHRPWKFTPSTSKWCGLEYKTATLLYLHQVLSRSDISISGILYEYISAQKHYLGRSKILIWRNYLS